MYILGVSGPKPGLAAALVNQSGVVAAIEEAKLARRHTSEGIPERAIRFCLDRAGIRSSDIDLVAVAARPFKNWASESWRGWRLGARAPLSAAFHQLKAAGDLGRALSYVKDLRLVNGDTRRPTGLEHHHCHAASAFYASPFERAALLTLDENGDGFSGLLAVGEGSSIRVLNSIPFPHSLAWVFSRVTDLIGFVSHQDEHKTQWLSLEAEPVFAPVFLEMFRRRPSELPKLDARFLNRCSTGRLVFSKLFYRRLGLGSRKDVEASETIQRQLASSIQQACSVLATDLAGWLRQRTEAQHLCLAGGLFLNPLLVAALERNTGFQQVFVQPAAGNAGCALGAAWLAWHQVLGKPRQEPIAHLNWGPQYTSQEIKPVLDNCKIRYRWYNAEAEKLEETSRLLGAGKTVAWFQGAAEFGPRALGNRSLLASPWAPHMKDNLNRFVKHREPFRPFAVAVPEEDAAQYFICTPAARFMASVGTVLPSASELLKEFLLPGNRIRVHVVERQANPGFWRLLKQFGKNNPAPILVNASLNLFGEPLVITPRDAVQSFFCSGIDALVIDSFMVTKSWEVRLVVDTPQHNLSEQLPAA